jgi:HEAT repeat protein
LALGAPRAQPSKQDVGGGGEKKAAKVLEVEADLDSRRPAEKVRLQPDGTLVLSRKNKKLFEAELGVEVAAGASLNARSLRIAGRRVVHVKASLPDRGRAVEGVLVGRTLRRLSLIWSGATGPRGRDGEYSVHLKVGPKWILTYQALPSLIRCDERQPRLFLKAYDFNAGRMRPIAPTPRAKNLPVVGASTQRPSGVASPAGLSSLRFQFASTRLGDGGESLSLSPPHELQDGDPDTAWVEGKGGVGVGEFLEARGMKTPYKIVGMRLIPGHAESPETFNRHNRLRSFVLRLGPKKGYLVEIGTDPVATGKEPATVYWAMFPKPVTARCATLIIRSAYKSEDPPKTSPGGRTAISEIAFLTELDLEGGISRLLRDMDRGVVSRDTASQILRSLGRKGASRLRKAMGKATRAGRQLLVEVLYESDPSGSAPALVDSLPGLPGQLQRRVLARLASLKEPPVRRMAKLLDRDEISVRLKGRVIEALGEIGSKEAARLLAARLGKGPASLRTRVVDGLADSPVRALSTDSLLRWEAETPARAKADRIWAAGLRAAKYPELKKKTAARLLSEWPKAASFEVRFRILQALGRCFSPAETVDTPASFVGEAVSLLGRVSRDDEEELLRWAAVKALSRSRAPGAADLLAAAASDSDPRVRVEAITAMAARKHERAGRLSLSCALTDPWSWARLECFRSVAALCPQGGGKQLAKAVEMKAGVSLRVILHTMTECRYPEVRPVLRKLLKDYEKKPALAGFAARRLVELGVSDHVEMMMAVARKLAPTAPTRSRKEKLVLELLRALTELVEGPAKLSSDAVERAGRLASEVAGEARSPSIKVEAVRLLAAVCPPSAPATLRSLVERGSGEVRREAARALRRCPRR